MRGFVQALWNWKNLEKHLYFCPFWMPTTWGKFWAASTKAKIFVQNALTKPRFRRDRWRGIAPPHVPWHFSYSFIWYILPHPSRKAVRHDHFMRATTTGLHCQIATGKATTVGAGQWYFSKELGGSAGVKLPWTRFAIGRQMNPKHTGARANRCAKI